LIEIKSRVEKVADTNFNSVLLNYYRHHRDSMGLHSDDEPELGRRPIIASVSLGEERTFLLKHKTRKDVKVVRLKLASGSLLLMKGDTQHCWKHGIEKEKRPCGRRINLTFRRICGQRGTNKPTDNSAFVKCQSLLGDKEGELKIGQTAASSKINRRVSRRNDPKRARRRQA
jgi:hypothetical protein